MSRATIAGAFLASVLFGLAAAAQAGGSQTRTYGTEEEFRPGELDHVALTPDGRLILSPAYEKVADLEGPVAWCVALAPDGSAYVGTGHDGKLWKVTPKGDTSAFFDAEELEILAVAVSAQAEVYAASSPEGKVYKIDAQGQSAVFYDPPERYIWALRFDDQGRLLVATGDPAVLHRVTSDGKDEVLLKADETHILSLALAPSGEIYAGTGGDGYVYRVGGGAPNFVVLDTEASEVKGLSFDSDGTLWVVASGKPGSEGAQPMPVMTVTARASVQASSPGEMLEAVQAGQAPGGGARPQGVPMPLVFPSGGQKLAILYRIVPGESPEEVWRSTSFTPYDLASYRGQPVIASGDEGRLLAIDTRGRATVLADLPAAQVTAFAAMPDGGLVATVSNLAGLYRIDGRAASQGTYTSPVVDASTQALWGGLTIDGKGKVKAESRSGNTGRAGNTWSPWIAVDETIASPAARYVQFRITLKADGVNPEVHAVKVAFLPTNRPPKLNDLEVLAPHAELRSSSPPVPSPTALRGALGRKPRDGKPGASTAGPPPPEQESYGMRSARWTAEDPDGDEVRFGVEYRGIDESTYKPLAEGLTEAYVAWDETALPDGRYMLRVNADDTLANAGDRAKSTSIESEPLLVDLTPPTVEFLKKSVKRREASFTVRLHDAASTIASAEYALDGEPWENLLAADGVYDEASEEIILSLENLEPGEHAVVVRATDEARGVGSGKAVIQLTP